MQAFYPNCTLPPSSSPYVVAPDVRGTLSIVWSCMTILILCTWTIQRLNVPEQSTPVSRRQKITLLAYRMAQKLKWMLVTVLMPEFIAGKALADRISAASNKHEMHDFAVADGVEWTMVHAHFTNMGGFAVRFASRGEGHNPRPSSTDTRQQATSGLRMSSDEENIESKIKEGHNTIDSNTLAPILPVSCAVSPKATPPKVKRMDTYDRAVHAYFEDRLKSRQQAKHALEDQLPGALPIHRDLVLEAVKGARNTDYSNGFRDWFHNIAVLQSQVWVLDAKQLCFARRRGLITTLPEVSEEEISDQSNGDALLNILAVLQVLWLIFSVLSRFVTRLPVTQLEIATFAFTWLSIFTYACLWNKPKDIYTIRLIHASRPPSLDELKEIAALGPTRAYAGSHRMQARIPNNVAHHTGTGLQPRQIVAYGAVLAATVFGAIHFLAWGFEFPTIAELWLWRASAVLLTGLPLSWIVAHHAVKLKIVRFFYPTGPSRSGRRHLRQRLWTICSGSGLLLYFLCRLFIIVEVFRTLAFLPPEAFRASWTPTIIPHLD